jgi:hypothetical protein
MAESLREQHPDVVLVTKKWNRWQHHVDYKPFQKNKLKLKNGVTVRAGTDNYGMDLKMLKETGDLPSNPLTDEGLDGTERSCDS